MAITATELLAGFKTGGGEWYSQVESADPELNPEVMSVIAAGDTHPRFAAIGGRRHGIPFSVGQVAAAIAEMGSLGANLSALNLYYRTVERLSGRDAVTDTNHTRFTATLAFGYLTNITAGHRQMAMARGRIIPVFDGTNAPLIRVGNSAITDTPTTDETFVLGTIVLPSANILEGCNNLDVNLNPEIFEQSDESRTSTTFAAGDTIRPVISFTTTDRDVYALDGTDVSGTKIHLIRKKNLAETYADNETQHIRLTIPQGLFVVQSISGRPAEKRCEIHAVGDDSNGYSDVPLTWSVNVAVNNT